MISQENYYIKKCNNCLLKIIFYDCTINFENRKIFCDKTCKSSYIINNENKCMKNKNINNCIIKYKNFF